MGDNIQNKEINKFFKSIQEDINSALISEEDGANPEQLFAENALSILADVGETENYRISYDEKPSKRGIEHKINAYALYENYETLDLFVCIYKNDNDIQSVPKPDAEKALDRLGKFFRHAIYNDYAYKIEESSEIFDLAQTLANADEVKEYLSRVNLILLTNGRVKSEIKPPERIAGHPVFYRIIDIDFLYNISANAGEPIEINFHENGVNIPCIGNLNENKDYSSYLAIIPGSKLAEIYEKYGPRLLEQNVRSFLQFTGKINKGIRNTILNEPHMFMAFNNGIAATAEEVKIIDQPDKQGKAIGYIKDFQIVNGGQTTASIYHTWKKHKADVSSIFVPLKLTIIKDSQNFGEIVGRIAEYANTQNKISASDLSSNRENLVILEKLSRTVWAPQRQGQSYQTRWFFERSRGQYRNERVRIGITPSKKKQFDKQNPRNQMFTKEQLAKFINCYRELSYNKKIVIGPHIVVRGSQKNYMNFLNYNFTQKPDNIFFEDTVALAIIFKSAEKIYGVKPHSIGDLRYITVPYSIAWLGYKLNYQLDLYEIWKAQQISEILKEKLYEVMLQIEKFIKDNAPGALYGEWAKKEECWNLIKEQGLGVSLKNALANDLLGPNSSKRKKISQEDTDNIEINEVINRLREVHPNTWRKIESWGKETGYLSHYKLNVANTLSRKIKYSDKFNEVERKNGEEILDLVIEEAPELFYDMEEFIKEDEQLENNKPEITIELIQKVVQWDKKNKRLKPFEYRFMADLAEGKKSLTDRNKYIAGLNLKKVKRHGFSE